MDSKLGANPKVENGHLDLANELVETLARTNFSPYESRILWVLWRKTYSWHKKEDWISVTQFADKTGLDRGNAGKALRKLVSRNIIYRKDKGGKIFYGFQKDYTKWGCVLGDTLCGLQRHNKRNLYRYKDNKNNKTIAGCVLGDTDKKEFLNWYCGRYKEIKGKPYLKSGKDFRLIDEMLKIFPVDQLKELTERFFIEKDPFPEKTAGYTISVLRSMINKLASTKKKVPIGLSDFSKWE